MELATNEHLEHTHRASDEALRMAEHVRAACIDAVMRGYEEARIAGLCHEGAWECAIGALHTLQLDGLLAHHDPR